MSLLTYLNLFGTSQDVSLVMGTTSA